jgi:hypothetical protein
MWFFPQLQVVAQTPMPNPYKAPLYWSVYEHHILKDQLGVSDNYIPESEFRSNIDFVDIHLKSSGYNMICVDGWGDVPVNTNGYRTAHSRHWEHDYPWWSSYLQQRGMTLGMYDNPLWLHVGSSDTTTKIAGTNILVSSLINNADPGWCQVDRPGAEQYVKGYIKYYADMGIKYLRVDFLSWYESGLDRYSGQVGITNRPHAHYVTALKWMREAADTNGIFLSLVMPNLFTQSNIEAQVERQYGHMIRVDEDVFEGGWTRWSDNARGVKRVGWSVYANAVDGLTYWSYIGGRSNMIPDPDFLRLNTFSNNDEKKSVVSICLIAGGSVTPSDQHKTIGNDVWIYVNPELMALRTDRFVAMPKTNDPTQASSQIWKGQLTNGDWVVGLFNRENSPQNRSINFSELGLATANVRDMWAHTNLAVMSSFSANIPAHGCRILKISTNSLAGPIPMHVQSLVIGTQAAASGGSFGAATVTIKDNVGNPVSGATVYVTFSGSYGEKVSGITDLNGAVTLVTTGTANDTIKVTADVAHVTHANNAYAADQNVITSVGERMFAAGTFSNWRLKDNSMRWVNDVWEVISMPFSAGMNYQMKFANTMDWSGDDWGNAAGMSGMASLTTGGAPNIIFTPLTNGLYTITFNPVTLAYSIQLQWQTDDVGAVGRAGIVGYDNSGMFTLLGSGLDIQNTADEFRYVYQWANGDTEMRARIANVQPTDPWAKAGVMIRESTNSGSRYAGIFITPNNGVTFQWRSSTSGNSSTTTINGLTTPKWVRILRSTNIFKGFYSSNGVTWTQVGVNQSITMSNTAAIGLALTSHKDGTLTTSYMDSVVVGPLNTPPVLTAISNQTIMAGRTLTLTNSASDTNLPSQTLLFNLVHPPGGASINATNGIFAWRLAIAQSPSTQTVAVAVSDNGVPSMSATQTFLVNVARPANPIVTTTSPTNDQMGFWVNGDSGPDYIVQASTNLTSWATIANSNAPTLPFFWNDTNSITAPLRFYRVLLAP